MFMTLLGLGYGMSLATACSRHALRPWFVEGLRAWAIGPRLNNLGCRRLSKQVGSRDPGTFRERRRSSIDITFQVLGECQVSDPGWGSFGNN